MAVTRKIADKFPNRAFESVTMSAANTVTFSQIQFGVGLFQGVAVILHKVEWYPSLAALRELKADTDDLSMAVTNRDDLSTLSPTNQSVLAFKRLMNLSNGTPGNGVVYPLPWVTDFSEIIGGGLILPANPLYIGMTTAGAVSASAMDVVAYVTFRELSDAEYVELVQTIMPANL